MISSPSCSRSTLIINTYKIIDDLIYLALLPTAGSHYLFPILSRLQILKLFLGFMLYLKINVLQLIYQKQKPSSRLHGPLRTWTYQPTAGLTSTLYLLSMEPLTAANKSFKLMWRCYQLLSGFLAKGHLPLVSGQSRLSAG